ncbi:MAG: glycosyltransferase family 1 protein [Prevotella sp.]|nr:glycosyltransferase family 1 protein [Prevotella sp.]
MEIEQILTKRNFMHLYYWDLAYEWEDVLSKQMGIPLHCISHLIDNRYVRHTPIINKLFKTRKVSFLFDMGVDINPWRANNKKNIIPCIIDFYLKDDEKLNKFYKSYSNNPVVLVSSYEVYSFLKEKGCPLNIKHFALSISDIYTFDEEVLTQKEYDLVLMGRQNPVLKSFLDKYIESHKDFKYVYRVQKDGQFLYYTSDGKFLGDMNTREQYMDLMKKARCGFYSTPGIDNDGKRPNDFNQVTPRFLELLTCGCHVIARYKDNPDTEYYQLKDFSKSINTYEEFEAAMDYARTHEIPVDKYKRYLSNHYTSKRAELLKQILSQL